MHIHDQAAPLRHDLRPIAAQPAVAAPGSDLVALGTSMVVRLITFIMCMFATSGPDAAVDRTWSSLRSRCVRQDS